MMGRLCGSSPKQSPVYRATRQQQPKKRHHRSSIGILLMPVIPVGTVRFDRTKFIYFFKAEHTAARSACSRWCSPIPPGVRTAANKAGLRSSVVLPPSPPNAYHVTRCKPRRPTAPPPRRHQGFTTVRGRFRSRPKAPCLAATMKPTEIRGAPRIMSTVLFCCQLRASLSTTAALRPCSSQQ